MLELVVNEAELGVVAPIDDEVDGEEDDDDDDNVPEVLDGVIVDNDVEHGTDGDEVLVGDRVPLPEVEVVDTDIV